MGIFRDVAHSPAFPLGKGDRAAVEGVVRRTIPNCGTQEKTFGSPSRGSCQRVTANVKIVMSCDGNHEAD